MKVSLRGREEMSNDVLAQVHVENAALKLFNYADNEDRNGRFHVWVMCVTSIQSCGYYSGVCMYECIDIRAAPIIYDECQQLMISVW